MKNLVIALTSLVLLAGCMGSEVMVDEPEEEASTPALTASDCFNDAVFYEVAGTPLKFCYMTEWGEPSVEDVTAGEVEAKKVVFANAATVAAPEIYWQKGDYPEGSELKTYCYDCINPAMPEEVLRPDVASQLDLSEDDVVVTKSNVYNARAIRVHVYSSDSLIYLVPDAFDGYHMKVSGRYELAAQIDDMAQWMMGF
jgi:hypothetical protein